MGNFVLILLLIVGAALAVLMLLIRFLSGRKISKGLLSAFLALSAAAIGLTVYEAHLHPFDTSGGAVYADPLDSPSGRYTASAFHRPYGGAAGGVTVWVDVAEDGGKAETVYYAEANSRFGVHWSDDGLLSITNEEPDDLDASRSVELEVGKEIYHDTGKACGSFLMKMKYQTCIAKMEREPF